MAESGAQSEEEPADPHEVSVLALRPKTKRLLSSLLNPVKVIPTDGGLLRDWQGLAELMGISGEHMPLLQQHPDPMQQLLRTWSDINGRQSTVKKLIEYLEELERFDVLDDSRELIDNDVKLYDSSMVNGVVSALDAESDRCILTGDDLKRREKGQMPVQYDAFVLYDDEDIRFATEVIETMEKQRNLKFCVKDRDLVGGVYQHEAIIKLIAERCNRLIVILSPSFFKSSANKFFFNFAQNVGIDQQIRKIIPVIYTYCEIPMEFKLYHMLDFQRSGQLWNFWDKLYESVRQPERVKPKTINLNRSVSQQVRSLGGPINLKGCSTLKPKKDGGVTFNSMVNLSESRDERQPSPNTSQSTVSIDSKKSKTNWMKKLTGKRKFWRKSAKQKMATTT